MLVAILEAVTSGNLHDHGFSLGNVKNECKLDGLWVSQRFWDSARKLVYRAGITAHLLTLGAKAPGLCLEHLLYESQGAKQT